MTVFFEEDWKKYPGAIIDYKTKNTSFIRLAGVFRAMGVRNNAFILALHNPELQGVDPFDPYLTQEQKLLIAWECKENFWYFLREVARAPAIGGSDSTPVDANRGNIALFWLFFCHITVILIQIRQTGKTFNTSLLMRWLLDIGALGTKINLLTKDDPLRRQTVQLIKDIGSELPGYLQAKGPDDLNNTEEITINALNNRYSTHVSQQSEKAARKLGRGFTVPVIHGDEAAFIDNFEVTLAAAGGGMTAAMDKARANGSPYGMILSTTAGKKDSPSGKFVYGMLQGAAVYTERLFDCRNLEELENMVRGMSRAKVYRVAAVFNHRMLGKTDDWLREKLEISTASGEEADRDYFNLWTSGNSSHPLPLKILERITASVRDVAFTDLDSGFAIRWYIQEDEIHSRMANGKFVLGVDPSDAGGGDFFSFILLDVETLEVLASCTVNEVNLLELAKWVFSYWFVRFDNITGVIERKSSGAFLLDTLITLMYAVGMDPFKRLFNTVVHEFMEKKENYKEIDMPMNRRNPDVYVRFKKAFGFATSGSGFTSRSDLYGNTLQLAAKRCADKIYDKTLIDQISGLETKNDRVDHAPGEHDDSVIGWLLANWLITKGMNLAFYGIPNDIIGCKALSPEHYDPVADNVNRQQAVIKSKMVEISERMVKEKDEFIVMKLEQQLRALSSKLVITEDEVFGVDDLLSLVKEKRKQNVNQRHTSYRHMQQIPTTPSYSQHQNWY